MISMLNSLYSFTVKRSTFSSKGTHMNSNDCHRLNGVNILFFILFFKAAVDLQKFQGMSPMQIEWSQIFVLLILKYVLKFKALR